MTFTFNFISIISQYETGGTGTICINRLKGCAMADLSKSSRGTCDYAYDSASHIVLIRWMDSKPVSLVSNCNGVNPLSKAKHWSNAAKA